VKVNILTYILLFVLLACNIFFICNTYRVTEPVSYGTIDTTYTRIIKNYRTCIDSLRAVTPLFIYKPVRIDTFTIENIVYRVPIIPYVFNDSIPIHINNNREFLKFNLLIDGYVTQYSIASDRHDYYIEPVKKYSLKNIVIGCAATGIIVFLLAGLLLD